MTEIYENIVREYLELNNYIVITDLKFKKHGWSDVDIVAFRNTEQPKLIVGEVKSATCSPGDMNEIFEHLKICEELDEIKSIFGKSISPKKYLFCWSASQKVKEMAKKEDVEIVEFSTILNFMIEKIHEFKRDDEEKWLYQPNYPNLMLLQLIRDMQKKKRIDWSISDGE